MKQLLDLAPTTEPWPEAGAGVHRLTFNCPSCGARMFIAIRIGAASHVPQSWGASSLDPATMTITPSIANPRHGRIVCPAHFTIDGGKVIPS
jgi:hypothetical protein